MKLFNWALREASWWKNWTQRLNLISVEMRLRETVSSWFLLFLQGHVYCGIIAACYHQQPSTSCAVNPVMFCGSWPSNHNDVSIPSGRWSRARPGHFDKTKRPANSRLFRSAHIVWIPPWHRSTNGTPKQQHPTSNPTADWYWASAHGGGWTTSMLPLAMLQPRKHGPKALRTDVTYNIL